MADDPRLSEGDYSAWDVVVARFEPLRRDDLKPGAEEWIGLVCEWRALWRISERDGGPYVGQLAWGPVDFAQAAPFSWVPSSDLVRGDPRFPYHRGSPHASPLDDAWEAEGQ